MPSHSPGMPTLCDFYLDLSLEAWVTSEDNYGGGFGWQTYFNRRSFSKSLRVKIRGNKRPQKKNKKSKKKKSKAKKKLEITSEEQYVPPVVTPFTLYDYIPKRFFCNDSSDDDPVEGEVAQCCMVLWADECKGANHNPTNTTQEVDQITLRSSRQLQPSEPARKEKEKKMALKELPT